MSTILLEPCPTEDSVNCFWDGSHSGNGVGTSFWNYEGTTVYFDVPETATPVGVYLTIDETDEYAEAPSWEVQFTWDEVISTPQPAATETPDAQETTATTTQVQDNPAILAETGLEGSLTLPIALGAAVLLIGGWWLLKANEDRWKH